MLEHAVMCMYWPGITDVIKDSISVCKACLTYSDKNQHKPYISDAITKPWSHVSLDNFEFHGQYFLMVLDISTKFFVVRPVPSLNTDAIIQLLTCIFSECGLPENIHCDRGRYVFIFFCSIVNTWASTFLFPVHAITVETLLKVLLEP